MGSPNTIESILSRTVVTASGCREWQRARDKDGYGLVALAASGARMVRVHRFVYELFVGPVSAGECVLHRCDNPPCCEPEHLFLGSHQANSDDKFAKGRARFLRGEECPQAVLDERAVLAARQLYAEGLRFSVIAREFGMPAGTIRDAVLGVSWGHLPNPPASRGRSLLTSEQIDEAARLHAAGATFAELGRRYGVERASIRYAIRRKVT